MRIDLSPLKNVPTAEGDAVGDLTRAETLGQLDLPTAPTGQAGVGAEQGATFGGDVMAGNRKQRDRHRGLALFEGSRYSKARAIRRRRSP